LPACRITPPELPNFPPLGCFDPEWLDRALLLLVELLLSSSSSSSSSSAGPVFFPREVFPLWDCGPDQSSVGNVCKPWSSSPEVVGRTGSFPSPYNWTDEDTNEREEKKESETSQAYTHSII
jgi:hypothetical protein